MEDEFLIALDLEAAMTGHGFEICGLAPNAEEARSLAMNHLPDVVLVDVYLGGAREGIETARWLRDVCDASVVLVTAHTDDATLERIREVVPGSPILAKPVYRESLPAAVAEVVPCVGGLFSRPLSERWTYDTDDTVPATDSPLRERRVYRLRCWARRIGLSVESLDGGKVAIVTTIKRAEELLARELEDLA